MRGYQRPGFKRRHRTAPLAGPPRTDGAPADLRSGSSAGRRSRPPRGSNLFPATEPVVGPLRERHTPDAPAGMPAHVTLVYPFLDDTLAPGAAFGFELSS